MATCSICGHSGLDHRSSIDCVARLLHQLAEGRAEYARLEERYNALAGTLRSIQQRSEIAAAEPGNGMEAAHRLSRFVQNIATTAQNALAFAGDPQIDR